MRKLVITITASAAILFLILIGWSANAVTGAGPSKALPNANYTLRHEVGCRGGWGRYVVGQDSFVGAGVRIAGAVLASDRRSIIADGLITTGLVEV